MSLQLAMSLQCRSCKGFDMLGPVVDLGMQYLSDFRSDDTRPPRYPLDLYLCQDCSLVQLGTTVDRSVLYTDAYGFRSGVNENNRKNLQRIVKGARHVMPYARNWLDIASNDGTLLSFVPKHIYRVGIDPVDKFASEAREHTDTIITDFFHPQLVGGPYDIITSISMFYDIDNLDEFVSGVKSILNTAGIWVIQQNFATAMLANDAVDNICHEHLTYFTIESLEHLLHRHELEIIDVQYSPVNGGSYRTTVAHMGVYSIEPTVRRQKQAEALVRADQPTTWHRFSSRVSIKLEALRREVRARAEQGWPAYAYGASTRGAVIMQAAGITASEVPCVVERQPEKVGKIWSPIGIPIISEDTMRKSQPGALLCLPYWNRDQFIDREALYLDRGGEMIFPLPEIEVYTR